MERLARGMAHAVVRTPWLMIAVALLLTAVFGALSTQQEQVTGNEGFSPDNAELNALERSNQLFGSGQSVLQVLIEPEGGDAFTADAYAATQAIEESVRGVVPAERLADDGNQPAVLSYFAPLQQAAALQGVDPTSLGDEQLAELYRQAFSQSPEGLQSTLAALLPESADAAAAQAGSGLMLVFIDTTDLGQNELIELQQNVAEAVRTADVPDTVEARAFAFELLFGDDSFLDEVARLFTFAALIILVVLAIVYFVRPRGNAGIGTAVRRTAADVVVTLVGIFMAIAWMQGMGVLLGPDYLGVIGAFNPVTQIVPILLIGLGVDYAIHLTSRYREEISDGRDVDQATRLAISTVGVALILATLTSVVGFLTNLTNPVPALRDFGILAAVGIVAAFLVLLTVVPAIRVLLDRRAQTRDRLPREAMASTQERVLPAVMSRTAILAERLPVVTLGVTLILGLAGAYGLTQLSTEFSFTDFVSEDDPNVQVYNTIQEDFGGGFGETTDVLFQGDVATPEVHNAMVEAYGNLADVPDVRTVSGQASATMPVTVLGQVLSAAQQAGAGAGPDAGDDAGAGAGGDAAADDDGAAGDVTTGDAASAASVDPAVLQAAGAAGLGPDLTVPEDADVAALYTALLEAAPEQGSQVLAPREGGGFAARASNQPPAGEQRAGELAANLDEAFAPVEETGIEATPTSQSIISEVIVNEISQAQLQSLAITVIAAMILLIITFFIRLRRPFLGFLTVLPVGLVLLWTFGLMAALGIPFSPVTATISALAIGIGVPFTIHVAIRFQEDRFRHATTEEAIRSTTRFTGGALAGSAFTTMAGFGVLAFSSLTPFRQLGIVVAIAIGCSLVASVLVLPSMLALWDRWHRSRGHVQPVAPEERAGALQ